jgi:hypothetical protein
MKRLLATVVVLITAAAVVGLLTGGAYADVISGIVPGGDTTPEWVEYENDRVQNDGDAKNDHNFGQSLKFDGTPETSLDDLFVRMDGLDDGKVDPVLGCAIAQALDLSHGTKFLDNWSSALVGERANTAVDYYVNDNGGHRDEYLQMIESVKDEIKKGAYSVEDLDHYESQMYQIPGTFDGGKRPALTLKPTKNDNGHAIVIRWSDGTTLKLRVECGGQPVDVPGWTPPENPPTETETPPPTTTAPPETTSPPTETTLTPKDPSVAPVRPSDPDIGGKVDTEHIMTDETPRETSPSTYVAPDPPKSTEAKTEPVQTQPPATEAREIVTGSPYSVPFEEVAPATVPETVATDAPHGALSDQQEKDADAKFG